MDSLFYCRMGKSRLKATTATGATRYATNRELSVPINRRPPYLVGSTASYASRQNIDLFKKPKLKKEVPNSKSINVQTLRKKI